MAVLVGNRLRLQYARSLSGAALSGVQLMSDSIEFILYVGMSIQKRCDKTRRWTRHIAVEEQPIALLIARSTSYRRIRVR